MTEAQFVALMTVLLEMRDGILGLGIVEAPPAEECAHPDEARISLATPGDPYHWICQTCRYEHRGVTQN